MNRRTSVWIGDLDSYIDEEFLKEAFQSLGETLCQVKIIRKSEDSLGYGFLEFPDEDSAQRVLHQYNGKCIPNSTTARRFKLNHANYNKDGPQPKDYSLFVGDLSPEVDDLALFDAFVKKYKTVKLAKVINDSFGVSKGYGFVRIANKSEYDSALIEMQNAHIGSSTVRVSTAQPKRLVANMTPAVPSPDEQQQQQWQQQYPGYDYQSYYAAWQNYQSQNQYYNYDQRYGSYGAYQYQQQYPAYTTEQQQPAVAPAPQPQPPPPTQQYPSNFEATENTTEEHDVPLDVDHLNGELMQRNEELYTALDDSRWLPVENLDPPLVRNK